MHLLGSLLAIHGSLLAHGSENNDVGFLGVFDKHLLDLFTNVIVWDLDILLGGAIIGHERQEAVIGNVEELVFLAANVGDIHVVGGWAQVFELLASEDVNGNKMDLGVTVLASLGGGHFDNLARAVLDHNVTVFAKSRTLHGVGGRGTGVGALKGVLLMLSVVGHGCGF